MKEKKFVVEVNGALSSTIATVPGIEFPLSINVDSAGSFAYAGNSDGSNPQIIVIDAASNSQVGSVLLTAPARDTHYSAADNVLYAALNDETLVRIDAAGTSSLVIDSTALSGGPSDLVFNEATKTAVAAQPVARWR
ncbi:MAG: hypothetical protein L0Y44_05630 [Phycisphaerales bacterium]|nr:hypothetical protein [Phycisphaerales bacterium]MCI0630119.1 hypothetical protein [Phycisphaerales bacterium]MCI0676325.1 hypothetical protein [Phycisphaerales bacterium]